MSGSDLEAVLDNANLDDLDDILSRVEAGESEEDVLASMESGDTGGDPTPAAPPEPDVTPEPEPVVAADPVPAAPVEPIVEEPEPVLLAKDGKNHIPYSELQDSRAEVGDLKGQLAEMQRASELLKQQLTDAEITPKELPENVRYTAEQLKDLESFGELGEATSVMAQQLAALQDQVNASGIAPTEAPVAQPDTNPYAVNPDTLRWADKDSDWRVVESVNASLVADPNWMGKTEEERIPELVRRTKAALGESTDESIDAAAAAALAESTRAAPNSLTDVGGEVLGQEKPIIQQLEDGDVTDIESYLAAQTAKGLAMDDVLTSLLQ